MTTTKPISCDAHVFIDTNIIMHFKPLHEIKWHEILAADCNHAPNRVFLIITQVLLNELNYLKDKKSTSDTRSQLKKLA